MSITEEKQALATASKNGLEAAIAGLLTKYSVKPKSEWQLAPNGPGDGPTNCPDASDDTLTLVPGNFCLDAPLDAQSLPLLPWRSERRFIELKQIVDTRTVEPLLMCRFACLTDGESMSLGNILYREFDLAEWLCGSPIERLYATVADERSANVVARLANGIVCSIEAATTLPQGTTMQDRHELIARRGIASDRVVDTQIAQDSIYAFTDSKVSRYTDVDGELFGLDAQEASLIRSAFEALSQPPDLSDTHQSHQHLQDLISLTWESDRLGERLSVEGVSA